MKLAFDFDNVIADFISTFIILAKANYGAEIDYNNIKKYNFSIDDKLGLSSCQYKKLIGNICSSEQNTGLQNPMENMFDTLSTIYHYKQKNNPIVIISNRRHRKPVEAWLNHYLKDLRYSLFIRTGKEDIDKAGILLALGYDGIIEDHPDVCKTVFKSGLIPIVMSHPWNTGLGSEYKRIGNLKEVLEIF